MTGISITNAGLRPTARLPELADHAQCKACVIDHQKITDGTAELRYHLAKAKLGNSSL